MPHEKIRQRATGIVALALLASVTTTLGSANAATGALDPHVAPGGNFDLSLWELQLPIGTQGSPHHSSLRGNFELVS